MPAENAQVVNNEAENRFEITVENHTGRLEYQRKGSQIALTHTEVPDALAGQGIGGKLAQGALEYARENKLSVVPFCSFVAGYIKRHPEYADLVEPQHRKLIEHAMQ
jgi:predicted GNAT family acetyltransferase